MASYSATPQVDGFAVRLETDDLLELARDEAGLADLQRLLDRHFVLIAAPSKEITAEAVGRIALHLGMPNEPPAADSPRARLPRVSADFPFINDFSSPPRELPSEPARPSYVSSLHYDGISAYSVQANFVAPLTTPNMWSDMRFAYADLPAHLRRIVDSGHALHAIVPPPGTPLEDFPPFEAGDAARRPLRIKHPHTNEPLLYLPKNPDSRIEGLPVDEGQAILSELWERIYTSPARHTARATENTLFIWDGLGTTHTNPAYPRDQERRTWFFIIPSKTGEVEPYAAV
ncbi:MAG: TauD/TfdA family dioxygenase [Maricaulaceae bacterium]|jgi:hypothetical protein